MKTFRMLIQLIPIVTALVRAVEQLIPGSGQGREKLALALDMADMAYQQDADLRAAWPAPAVFWAIVTGLITSAVGALNTAGVFTRSEAAES